MNENTGNDKGKVFNLTEQRQRRKTLGRPKPGAKKAHHQKASAGTNKLWLYVQLLVFLLVIWLLMRSCHF